MFDKIKQLTKDTAIYGISTIVGRFLTFLLVPFYTNIFSPEDYGVVANLYIFIAILNILYIYGMDAAYLKFASDKTGSGEKDNFSTPYMAVMIVSLFLSLLIVLLGKEIISLLEVPKRYSYLIYYTSLILFVDALSAIPFIKLRIERKAKKFATFKIINILANVRLNLCLGPFRKVAGETHPRGNLFASVVVLII